jgi:hypothetical protein
MIGNYKKATNICFSRNVIFSDSNNNVKRRRGEIGVWEWGIGVLGRGGREWYGPLRRKLKFYDKKSSSQMSFFWLMHLKSSYQKKIGASFPPNGIQVSDWGPLQESNAQQQQQQQQQTHKDSAQVPSYGNIGFILDCV